MSLCFLTLSLHFSCFVLVVRYLAIGAVCVQFSSPLSSLTAHFNGVKNVVLSFAPSNSHFASPNWNTYCWGESSCRFSQPLQKSYQTYGGLKSARDRATYPHNISFTIVNLSSIKFSSFMMKSYSVNFASAIYPPWFLSLTPMFL